MHFADSFVTYSKSVVEIDPTFILLATFFCQFPFDKELQAQTVSRKKL
jgi:hypothetical protein